MSAGITTAHPTQRIFFDPPEEDIRRILGELGDANITAGDIAFRRDIPLDALTLWMARPDIAERIDALESTFARRVRLIAANHLGIVATTLTRILQEWNEDGYLDPGELKTREHKRRSQEGVRKACALLMRLAHYTPGPTRRLDRAGAAHGGTALQSRGSDGAAVQSHAEPTPLPTITTEAPLPTPSEPSGYHHAPRGAQPEPQPAPALEPSTSPAPQPTALAPTTAQPPKSEFPNPTSPISATSNIPHRTSDILTPLTISVSPSRPRENKLDFTDLPDHIPALRGVHPRNWPKRPP